MGHKEHYETQRTQLCALCVKLCVHCDLIFQKEKLFTVEFYIKPQASHKNNIIKTNIHIIPSKISVRNDPNFICHRRHISNIGMPTQPSFMVTGEFRKITYNIFKFSANTE